MSFFSKLALPEGQDAFHCCLIFITANGLPDDNQFRFYGNVVKANSVSGSVCSVCAGLLLFTEGCASGHLHTGCLGFPQSPSKCGHGCHSLLLTQFS